MQLGLGRIYLTFLKFEVRFDAVLTYFGMIASGHMAVNVLN